jgi:hypothetical protein
MEQVLNKPEEKASFQVTFDQLLKPCTDDQAIGLPTIDFTTGCLEKVLLASYPRSGNTLIRSYLERITGLYTGSDHNTDLKLNKELFELGMTGEGHID